jgi:acyl-CoA dehydrogenase
MHELSRRLLCDSPLCEPVRDIDDWWGRHQAVVAGRQEESDQELLGRPLHRAALAGFAMDRLGYAFASGYHEALRFAIPELDVSKWALCATEQGGAHPRAIATSLTAAPDGREFRLSGAKQYASLGTHADGFVVMASTGQAADGRNRLVAVRVPRNRAGVIVQAMPATPFIPEIPHARVLFEDVVVTAEEPLPGDGYEGYLKPFRTVEDVHVQAAFIGWLVQVARRSGWPNELIEELLALLCGLASVMPEAPGPALISPYTHIALAGVLAQITRLVATAATHWAAVDDATRVRWLRDRPLLSIAGKARAKRREVAWQRLGS